MASSRLIFVNIATADLPATRAFFGELGFTFNETFCTDECACMVVSEQAYVMLQTTDHIKNFTTKEIADSTTSTEAILCVSADSREDVDAFADKALAAGGTPANDPMDYGLMYGRSFQDLDGHLWEVMWMDPAAVEAGPEAYAESC